MGKGNNKGKGTSKIWKEVKTDQPKLVLEDHVAVLRIRLDDLQKEMSTLKTLVSSLQEEVQRLTRENQTLKHSLEAGGPGEEDGALKTLEAVETTLEVPQDGAFAPAPGDAPQTNVETDEVLAKVEETTPLTNPHEFMKIWLDMDRTAGVPAWASAFGIGEEFREAAAMALQQSEDEKRRQEFEEIQERLRKSEEAWGRTPPVPRSTLFPVGPVEGMPIGSQSDALTKFAKLEELEAKLGLKDDRWQPRTRTEGEESTTCSSKRFIQGVWPLHNLLLLPPALGRVLARHAPVLASGSLPLSPEKGAEAMLLGSTGEVIQEVRDCYSDVFSEISYQPTWVAGPGEQYNYDDLVSTSGPVCEDASEVESDHASIPGKLCRKALKGIGYVWRAQDRTTGEIYYTDPPTEADE